MLTGNEILIQRDTQREFYITSMTPSVPYLNIKGLVRLKCNKPLHTITLTPEWIEEALNTIDGAWKIKK